MATDFFERQDDARRQTGRLVVLFALAVALIVLAVYGVLAALEFSAREAGDPAPAAFEPARLALAATGVLVVIASGSLYKVAVLREGGDAVARMLGGRPVDPGTTDPQERRLLNVVEEMAIASGTPVPPVYVLDAEEAINAFAAGFTPGDAVVAVTRGTVERLSRDELQGVIGHEFSHILNGDMRLNLRLIGLVHGILVIALIGQILMRLVSDGRGRSSSSSNSKDSGAVVLALFLFGVALWVIGSLGVLLGRVIKCAVSRQREYLADASSVQFTRNPIGLAGALRKITGTPGRARLRSVNAEQAAHMFFSMGVGSFAGLLATHPPLTERIRRLDETAHDLVETGAEDARGWDPSGGEARPVPAGVAPLAAADPGARVALAPEAFVGSVGAPQPAHVAYASGLIAGLPDAVTGAARDPFSARAIVYALLLDAPEARATQLAHLREREVPGTEAEVLRLRPGVEALGPSARVPLAELTFPALRLLSEPQYRAFRANVDALVKADGRVSLFEYALQRMLLRNLDRAFYQGPRPSVRYESIDGVFEDCTVLLSTLARLGHEEGTGAVERAFRLGMDRLQSRHPGEREVALLPPERCTLRSVDRALDRLAHTSPLVKERLLDACAACTASDGLVTPAEGELLRAIADSLDCPIPPLLKRPTAARAAAPPAAARPARV